MLRRRVLCLSSIALCLFSIAVTAGRQAPSETTIRVSATDKYNRIVTNLKKEDIKVFEDGVLRPITRFESADDLPISMEVLVDTSGSTRNQSAVVPVLAKLFIDAAIRRGKDTATITEFSNRANLVQPTTDDVSRLFAAIDKIVMQPAKGITRWISAVTEAANRLAAAPGRRVVLLVSDGMDNSDDSSKRMLETLQKNDVAVYPMYCFCEKGLPREPTPIRFTLSNWGGMTTLAKATGGTVYLPQSGDAQTLAADLRQIAREMASQHLVSFEPGLRKGTPSLHKIRIDVADPQLKGLQFKYRQRY